jgi:hypothetical protein
MVQIKGATIKEAVTEIKTHAGDQAFQKVLGFLDEDTRRIFEGEIIASTWYPLDNYARFLEVEVRVLANGREEVVTRGAEAANERSLRGIYKAFVKVGSPEYVIERIAAVHTTYFQGVSVDVQLPEPRKALIKYTGFEKQHRIMGFAIIGFFNKALELSGANDAVIYFTTLIEEGREYAELSIAWS